jgi:hypothetical protein
MIQAWKPEFLVCWGCIIGSANILEKKCEYHVKGDEK